MSAGNDSTSDAKPNTVTTPKEQEDDGKEWRYLRGRWVRVFPVFYHPNS